MAHWRDEDQNSRPRRSGPNVADMARGVYTSRPEENDYESRSWYRDGTDGARYESTGGPGANRPYRPTRTEQELQRDERTGLPGYGTNYGSIDDDYFRTTTGSDVGRYDRAGAASHRGLGPKTFTRTDERIHELVCELIAEDRHVDASDMEVEVREGVVHLSGTVPDRRMAFITEDLAESVIGVREVENRLKERRTREVPSTWEW